MVTARKVNTVQQGKKITFVSGAGTHLIESQGGKRSRNNKQAQVRYSKQNYYNTEGKLKKILDTHISKRHHQDALNRGKMRDITKIV